MNRLLSEIVARLRSVVWAKREDQELREEIAFHVEKEIERNVAAGMSPGEARRRAHITFGGVERMTERTREARGVALVTDLGRDLRLAWRRVVRSPAFSTTAVLTVGLALGATTAVLGVLRAVLLEPLPYDVPQRVVTIRERHLPERTLAQVAPGTFLDWREALTSVQGVSAYQRGAFTLTGDGNAEALDGVRVTDGLLPMLGVPPLLGRVFAPEESEYGRDAVVVLGHGLWSRRFGEDPGIVGRAITLGDRSYEVVGVMPEAFMFPDERAELWVPLTFVGARNPQNRGFHFLDVVARVAPGASLEAARSEIEILSDQLAATYPQDKAGWSAAVDPMLDAIVADARPSLMAVLASVALVLSIAVANLAAMLVVRGSTRGGEIATRLALGAGRGRLARQLLTESLVVAVLGGALGLVVAHWALGALPGLVGDALPRLSGARIDAGLVGFTFAIVLLTWIGFGTAPAMRLSGNGLAAGFRAWGRGVAGGRQGLRNVLVGGQIAVSVSLLLGAGLLVRSMVARGRLDPGFRVEGAHLARVTFPAGASGEERLQIYDGMAERFESIPGVDAAGFVQLPPTRPYAFDPVPFAVGPDPATPGAGAPTASEYLVTPGYFDAMGIALREGRRLSELDRMGAPRVAVVNETLARLHFQDRTPVGERIVLANSESGEPWEVVGVVADVRTGSLTLAPPPQVYLPYAQVDNPYGSAVLVVRAPRLGSPAEALRGAARERWPDLPLSEVRPVAADLAVAVSRERLVTWLTSAFAAFALGLSALGIYGVVAYSVEQRSHELGIRMAIGARPDELTRLVMGASARLAAWGIGAGLAVALVATRSVDALLYGVERGDPLTYVLVPLGLAGVVAVASWLPARRAARKSLERLRAG